MTIGEENGDIKLGRELETGLDSVRARVRFRLLFLLGEWFQDARKGTPYQTRVLGYEYQQSLTQQALDAAVRSVDGVTGITVTSLTVDEGNRVMNYSATIQTEFGSTQMGLELQP